MNDAELRALVREAVARHMGHGAVPEAAPSLPARVVSAAEPHPSHSVYLLVNTTDACVIEPSVRCDHCGYCKSHGH